MRDHQTIRVAALIAQASRVSTLRYGAIPLSRATGSATINTEAKASVTRNTHTGRGALDLTVVVSRACVGAEANREGTDDREQDQESDHDEL